MADHVSGNRFARMARLATAAARTTRDVLTAKAREKLGGNEAKIAESLQPTAAHLVEVLGELKGVATKLGQFAALVDQDTLPEEVRKGLTRLLNQAPQRMNAPTVRAVIAAELGQPVATLFRQFDDEPLAAASMGQVHGAVTADGQDVVVKIQYPGVGAAIESDLKNVGLLARALSMGGEMLDGRGYTEEIAATLRRELDYCQEVVQLQAFAQAVAPWPDLVVPNAVVGLSSTRVLTLERLHGPSLLQVAQDPDVSQERRNELGHQLMRAAWGPFLSRRLIHADPHPGNYVVMADGRLGILDFGATRVFSLPFVRAYWRVIGARRRSEPLDILELLESAGFELRGDDRPRARIWLDELSEIVERPIQRDHYDWAQCRISSDVRDLARKHALTALKVRAPDESVMFYRAIAGISGDLRMLRAAGDYRTSLMAVADVARNYLIDDLQIPEILSK